MSRTRRSVHGPLGFAFPVMGVLAAAALAVGAPDVRAQGAVPATQQTGTGSQSSPDQGKAGPKSSGTQAGSTATGAGGAPTGDASAGESASGGAASSGTTKPPPVCFKLTGRCVESAKGKAATKAGTAKDGTAHKRPLNLTAPDVRTVVAADELKEPLPTETQMIETQESQTVSVKTDAGVPPDVPGGFGALWWALNHPSQAWRILTPAE